MTQLACLVNIKDNLPFMFIRIQNHWLWVTANFLKFLLALWLLMHAKYYWGK